MNSLKTTAVIRVIFSTLILIGVSSKSTSGSLCTTVSGYAGCCLKDVAIRTEADATKFVFPNERIVNFLDPNISSSPKILFNRLPDVVQSIGIYGGHVPGIYIKQSLYGFSAFRCSLQEVIIDPTGTYILTELTIANNLLRSVPKNIGKLTNLVKLYLLNNNIETVSMNHFKDLTNLKILSLYNNLIVRVDTTVPLNLPNLVKLSLGANKLQYLSITFWNFPNLNYFGLSLNKLRSVINFPMQFPKLEEIYIKTNEWNCAWLEAVKSETSNIKQDFGESCPGKSVDFVCCQEYSSDENRFYSFEEAMTFGLLRMGENLQKAIREIDVKISKLTTDTGLLIDNKISDVDRTVQGIQEDVKSMKSRVMKQAQELQTVADDRKLLEKKISNNDKLTKDEFQWVKQKLNENRALLDDVVDDLYLEELEKQKL